MRYEADDIIADCNNTFYIIRSGAGGVYKTKADGHGAQEHDVVNTIKKSPIYFLFGIVRSDLEIFLECILNIKRMLMKT